MGIVITVCVCVSDSFSLILLLFNNIACALFIYGLLTDFVFFFLFFVASTQSFSTYYHHVFRSNPINADILYLSDKKRFESSHFNKSNTLIIYLHGFSERVPGGAGQSSQEMRDGMDISV